MERDVEIPSPLVGEGKGEGYINSCVPVNLR